MPLALVRYLSPFSTLCMYLRLMYNLGCRSHCWQNVVPRQISSILRSAMGTENSLQGTENHRGVR